MYTAKNWRKQVKETFDSWTWNDGLIGSDCRNAMEETISQVLQAQARDLAGKKEEEIKVDTSSGSLLLGEQIKTRNQHRQEVLERGKKWVK